MMKTCFIRSCKNDTKVTPQKLFFLVPGDYDRRMKWYAAVGFGNKWAPKSSTYCCEDHFDLENDVENWMHYKMIGTRIRWKNDVVPHKFITNPKPPSLGKESQLTESDKKRKLEALRRLGSKAQKKFFYNDPSAQHQTNRYRGTPRPWCKSLAVSASPSPSSISESIVLIKCEPFEADVTYNLAYNCAQCSYQALWLWQITYHVQNNHRESETGRMFNSTLDLEKYACVCCGSKSYYKLGRYYEKCTSTQEERTDSCSLDEQFEKYLCGYCECTTHSNLFLIKHYDSCGRAPATLNKNVHLPGISTECEIKPRIKSAALDGLPCDQCEYACTTKSASEKHLLKHDHSEPVGRFHCSQCSYRAKRKETVKKHMLTHATAKDTEWFRCSKCSYRSKQKSNLAIHVSKHAPRVEWFSCKECSYRTRQKGNLESHVQGRHPLAAADWYDAAECSYRSKRTCCKATR